MSGPNFTEKDLIEFHAEFRAHVDQYNADKEKDAERFQKLFDAQEKNTQAISDLIEETRGVIELQKNFQAAARLGDGVQRFGLWMAKWPIIGVGLYTIYQFFMGRLT
jgi:glutaredoxin 2